MLITYLRSSSYNDFSFCQHKYFLTYVLGFKSLAGVAAAKGNVVHKFYEILARYKKATQDKAEIFIDDSLGKFVTKDFDPNNIEYINELAFNFYKENTTHITLTEKDKKQCCTWAYKLLEYKNGMFNPLLRNILEPEFKFDIEIKEKWAEYQQKSPDGIIKGNFAIKGTLDHVSIINKNTIELIDLKTGKPQDFAAIIPKVKGFHELYADPQLMMYYWAACKVFPQYEHIIVSIFFSNHGGVYTLPFTKRDLPRCEELIKNRIIAIRNVEKPHVNWTWKCSRFCQYSKMYKDNKSYCKYFSDKINEHGINYVTNNFTQNGFNADQYSSGGGRIVE